MAENTLGLIITVSLPMPKAECVADSGTRQRQARVGLRGGRNKRHSTVDRFWAHVKQAGPNDCWLFDGASVRPSGHPHFHVNGRGIGAHKFSWLHHCGPIPVGLVVCHTCDVPRCVNPAHLFLGTQKQNVLDSRLKRHRRGMQKLTEEQVLQIRALAAGGQQHQDIAPLFGIARNTVTQIVNRVTWRHLPPVAERTHTPVHVETLVKHARVR